MKKPSTPTQPKSANITMSDLVWVVFGIACSKFAPLEISRVWWVSLLVLSVCGAIVGIVIAMVMRAVGVQVFKR
jgi:hypothetical protein